MSEHNPTLNSPTFQPIGPETRELVHDGVTYIVEKWTPRDLRLILPTGEFAGKFHDIPSIIRFLTYALEATH